MLNNDRNKKVRRAAAVVAFAMLAAIPAMAQGTPQEAASARTAMRYPDWSGQWQRIGSLNWPPEGYGKAGRHP